MSCLLASTGLSIIGYLAKVIYTKISKCNRDELGILSCSKLGITTLLNNIQHTDKYIYISLDELLKAHLTPEQKTNISNLQSLGDHNSIRNTLMPVIDKVKQNTREIYKGKKRIYYFSTDIFLLSQLIPARKIISILPSKTFHDKIMSGITDETTRIKIIQQRTDILSSKYKQYPVESYEDLKHVFLNLFSLKSKL